VAEGHEAGMGIKFVYDHPDQRDQLEEIVARMMTDSLGPLIFSRLVKKPKT
jgi:type IV pilus assembly protein PilZ